MLIYNRIVTHVYILQHHIYMILLSKYNFVIFFKLLSLFVTGIFTILTPCFISLLPILLSYISSIRDNILSKQLYFVGLFSSFILIIIPLYLSSDRLLNILNKLPIISGICFILISLNLLEILPITFIFRNLNIDNDKSYVYLQYYIIGLSIGFSSLPCNVSIILTTILWISNHSNILESIIYLLIYLFGCLFPFIIIFYTPFKLNQFSHFIQFWNKVVSVGGVILLSFGCFILFQNLLT